MECLRSRPSSLLCPDLPNRSWATIHESHATKVIWVSSQAAAIQKEWRTMTTWWGISTTTFKLDTPKEMLIMIQAEIHRMMRMMMMREKIMEMTKRMKDPVWMVNLVTVFPATVTSQSGGLPEEALNMLEYQSPQWYTSKTKMKKVNFRHSRSTSPRYGLTWYRLNGSIPESMKVRGSTHESVQGPHTMSSATGYNFLMTLIGVEAWYSLSSTWTVMESLPEIYMPLQHIFPSPLRMSCTT